MLAVASIVAKKCCRRAAGLGLLFLVVQIVGTSVQAAPTFFQVDPTGSYLLRDPGDQEIPATSIALQALGVSGGDLLVLQAVGAFQFEPGLNDDAQSLVAVFSGPAGILMPGPANSVPPRETSPTCGNNIPTDIAEDFNVPYDSSLTVQIPVGADAILFTPDDCLTSDNTDPNNDFGVEIDTISGDLLSRFKFERMWPTLPQPWYLGDPLGVALDADGFVYIADHVNHRMHKLAPDGRTVKIWGKRGGAEGDFNGPRGVATDQNGFVYVTDSGRVQKFTTDGEFVTQWRNFGIEDQFNTLGIAVDAEGFVYVTDSANHRIQKFTSAGEFVSSWGSQGTDDGQFHYPCGIAVSDDGFVFVTDGNTDGCMFGSLDPVAPRVQKFTSDGEFVTAWGGVGNGEGEFNEAAGVAVDQSGFVYVIDGRFTGRVQKFTSDGVFVSQFGTQNLQAPAYIAIAPDGAVYVSEPNADAIFKFDTAGQFQTQWTASSAKEGHFDHTQDVAVSDDGFVYVVSPINNRIQKFTSAGQFVAQWGTVSGEGCQAPNSPVGAFCSPTDLTVDGNGFVYVADSGNQRIQKFTSDGDFVRTWGQQGSGDGDFDSVDVNTSLGVAIDPTDSFVYVADVLNHRVQKFTTDGVFVSKWGNFGTGQSQFNRPSYVTVGNDGFVYVLDALNARAQKFTADGQFVIEWGSVNGERGIAVDDNGVVYVSGRTDDPNKIGAYTSDGQLIELIGGLGSGPLEFSIPAGLAVGPGGKLYVADIVHHRIQVLRPAGVEKNTKAIVVAGGGPFPGNALWDATQAMASFAYRTLTFQGFTKESIFYLSDDTDLDLDGNGLADDVDAAATKANLQSAITTWAADAEEVVVYITDHGGAETFRVSATQTVAASEMDGWLDQLQGSISGKVTVIYDACLSGSFVAPFTPPAGKDRVVITSSGPNELAYFTGQGLLSFSNFFWMDILNGKSVGEAYAAARDSVSNSSTPQSPLLDANANGVSNEQDDFDAVASQFIGSGTENFLDAPTIGSVSAPQTINGTSTATLEAFNVADTDGIGRVWGILNPPDFTGGSSDNPVTDMPTVEMTETPVGSGNYAGTFSGFTTPGTYQVAIYALDGVTNTSLPKLTTVSVGNPLTRRAVLVVGGADSDPGWSAFELAGTAAYQALKFQGYKDTEIAFLSATTMNGVEQLNTLSNVQFALAPAEHMDSQDVVVVLIGGMGGDVFALNGTESISSSALDTLLDALQAVLPGRLTMIMDAQGAGSFVSHLDAPAGGERKRIRIPSTTGSGPALFEQGGAVSFSRQFWQQVSNGARLRDAFVQARNAMELTSGLAQRPRLDADGDGDSDKFDLALVQNYSLGPGILLAGDAPLIGKVNDPVTLSDGSTTATLFAEQVTSTGNIARVFAVITPPTAPGVNPTLPLPTVTLNAVGGRYEASYGGFGPISGVYQVTIFAEDDEGVVSLPAVTQVTQLVGADVYESDNQFTDASVIVVNAIAAQAHTVHQAGDGDWVQLYGIAGQAYDVKAENVGANADLVLQLYQGDGTTLITARDDLFAGGGGGGGGVSYYPSRPPLRGCITCAYLKLAVMVG